MTKLNKTEAEVRVCKLTRRYYVGVGAGRSRKEWKTFRGALAYADRRGYVVVTREDPMPAFLARDGKTKIVQSLMGGKLVRIEENTPLCCDLSSETYWSM